jgi:branched-chain amino acid transport system permease protein
MLFSLGQAPYHGCLRGKEKVGIFRIARKEEENMLKIITKTGLLAFFAGALSIAGAESATAKVEGDTIILGAAVSLTGKYSTNGKNTRDGYDLAVKRINEDEGIKINGKSYKLKIIYYDDESTPARAAQLVERLINQDGVKYMLGPYSSGVTAAVAPVTEKYQIPMVEGNGASLSLFDKGYKYLFATLSTTEYYLKSAVELMAEKASVIGKKPSQVTMAMAFENDPFSQDVRAGVVEDAKKFGMKIIIDDKLGAALAVALATLLGSAILGLRGHYFAIGTLGLGVAAGEFASGWDYIGAGSGMVTPLYPGAAGGRESFFYYLMFALAALTFPVLRWLYSGRFGLTINAIRDDEDKAEALGIRTTRYKTTAWYISAFFLGLTGGAVGNMIGFIDPRDVAFAGATYGVWMVLMAILGGKGTLWGPVIGAAIFHVTQEFFWTYFLGWQRVALGLLIVLTVLFFPLGILGWARERWPELFGHHVEETLVRPESTP